MGWKWEEMEDRYEFEQHIVHAPASIVTHEDLEKYIGDLANYEFPKHKAPWNFHIIPNFEGGTAIFLQIHHCMADGIALVRILLGGVTPKPRSQMVEGDEKTLAQSAKVGDKTAKTPFYFLKLVISIPLLVVFMLIAWPDKSLFHREKKLTGKKVAAFSKNGMDLVRIKQACKEFSKLMGTKVTVNDMILAVYGVALDKYCKAKKVASPKQIGINMPINVRSLKEEVRMENAFAIIMPQLPVDSEHIGEANTNEKDKLSARLRMINKNLAELKNSTMPLAMYLTQRVTINCLPTILSKALVNFVGNKNSAVLSNVPGPTDRMWLEEKRIEWMGFLVPGRADIGLGLSALTYAGELRIGIQSDSSILDEPELLSKFFEESMELYIAAVKTPDNRV
jgi:diacylglycerol O-acyltransferase